ncbi:SCP-like extracellular [Sphingomonas sp. Root710]|uniref:CAP domain-containing protein n=1 Tax=Sphingomonas sp. Root710 TaxID=1736594 RepID=UPI0006F9DFAE|nr:CAP domain-containing protein [Sphingomonas sp. Root710]KRB82422.1 SCP-like extracellular [Sphingomonas sp. Root710]
MPDACRLVRALALPAIAVLTMGSIGRVQALEQRTLAIHNFERARLGIGPLKWDRRLAADADRWARHLARLGYLVHSPDDPADISPQGENLWAGTAGAFSADDMSKLWLKEKRNFKYGVFPDNSRTGDLEDVGHYTQMVWASSKAVGCALRRGRKDEFFVCRYSEGGNILGERPY